jgi:hypothetical protein
MSRSKSRLAKVAVGHAIQLGHAEILSLLLEHGVIFPASYVGTYMTGSTLLTTLFQFGRTHAPAVTRETKVAISRILVEHAKTNCAIAEFMRASLDYTITRAATSDCEILLEAGMIPSSRRVWNRAIQTGNEVLCLLLGQNGVDPFLFEEADENEYDPFVAAARLSDTNIFEYLLTFWDERFASAGGKNGDGDYPLHVVCCDPRVSLQAINVLVVRQAEVLSMVDGEQGLFPVHFAANWGASLDVVFCLLQHCAAALLHGGRGHITATAVGKRRLLSQVADDDGPVQKKAKSSTSKI